MSNNPIPPQAVGLAAHQPVEIPPLTGPSQADWEHHRALITHLYREEGKKLKEVMAIMFQHGHKASPRTYKNWIQRWGLDKKNKERDMVAIIRKKTQRDAIGKKSLFRVRGQIVTAEQVEHYFKRKKSTSNAEMVDAPTPSDVSCRTPSPKPFEGDRQAFAVTNNSREAQLTTTPKSPLTPKTRGEWSDLIIGDNDPSSPFRIDDNILQLTVQDVNNILSENPRVSRSPSPPQKLLLPEHLLFTIKAYYHQMFESRTWVLNHDGEPRINGATTDLEISIFKLEHHFFSYYSLATSLINARAYVESRRALSKMFNTISSLLNSPGLRTLYLLLDVIINLTRSHIEISTVLRRYIYAITRKSIAKNSPWIQICQLISSLDEELLEEILIASWKCISTELNKIVGLFNFQAHLVFIGNVYRNSPLEEERLLRKYLSQFEAESTTSNKSRSNSMQILLLLVNCLMKQNRYAEAEIVSHDLFHLARKLNNHVGQYDAMQWISWCHHSQGRFDLAEKYMRDCIRMRIVGWGMTDPFTVKNIHTLEIWLRQWGRKEEADQLKAQFDACLGPDETDLEMAQASTAVGNSIPNYQ